MLDANVLKQYPQIDCNAVQALLGTRCREDRYKTVVSDGGPAGVQMVCDISVYAGWSYEGMKKGFEGENRLFYILTSPKGSIVEQTTRARMKIGETVVKVSEETGIDYMVVDRGGSTPRGHYSLETELLARVEKSHRRKPVDNEIICPYFREDGRFIVGNAHHIRYGGQLVPAGEIESVGNKTFGCHSSDLRKYVEEKTEGRHGTADVLSVSLEKLYSPDYDGIIQEFLFLRDFGKIVINTANVRDLRIFCIALYNAMNHGHGSMLHAATGFIKESGTISGRLLLTRDEMMEEDRKVGGIIVIGSYTKGTTIQLETLKQVPGIKMIGSNSDLVPDEAKFQEEIGTALMHEEELLEQGVAAVVHTERELLSLESDSPEAALLRSVRISDAIQPLIGQLKVTPAFAMARGGITSGGVRIKTLKVGQATVLEQVYPGTLVWKADPESRFPGTPYVIFPGNVGETETLREAVERLVGG